MLILDFCITLRISLVHVFSAQVVNKCSWQTTQTIVLSSSGWPKKVYLPRPPLIEDAIFILGLSLFKTRTVYANIINDRSVPYHTAAISQYDPYVDLTKLNLSYLPSYSPIILHPTHPIIPLSETKGRAYSNWSSKYFRTALVLTLFPLWATFFLLANLYQSAVSARRIRNHTPVVKEIEPEHRKERRLSQAVQEVFEDVVDNPNLISEDQNEYVIDETSPLLDIKNSKAVSLKEEKYQLQLMEEQSAMLNGLRSLSWQRFGVHIHLTTHSHAAIIRRSKWRKTLSEGQIVIRHWLENQFQT